jgi:RimJ/RimL family protein N-acetyltransferase
MIRVSKVDYNYLHDYSQHLKSLSLENRYSRFGYSIPDQNIDQFILRVVYEPSDHLLWAAFDHDTIVGFGHLAKADETSYELAVSVVESHQRKGIGNRLVSEMLDYAKFNGIENVFMHCISENRAIQKLASKNNLTVRERGHGEMTSALEVPKPNFIETTDHILKEQAEILKQIRELNTKLTTLWLIQ